MKNKKKFYIFISCDFILFLFSIIMMITENNKTITGLAALEGVGRFAFYLLLFILSLILFAIGTLRYLIVRKKQKK